MPRSTPFTRAHPLHDWHSVSAVADDTGDVVLGFTRVGEPPAPLRLRITLAAARAIYAGLGDSLARHDQRNRRQVARHAP